MAFSIGFTRTMPPLPTRQNCDAAWTDLWQRFMPGVDWSGLEAEMETGWQRKAHILQTPFYYNRIRPGAAGALQIWGNFLRDQAGAVAAYRRALALGGTAPLPQLYATAGARLAFDADTLASGRVDREDVYRLEEEQEYLYKPKPR